ncbi:MAG TPA: hypothetical protein VMS37_11620 [Verrucomicrobiae bacterium]|nr:hypothetical protein [Verrucomicrobiae bacterium]
MADPTIPAPPFFEERQNFKQLLLANKAPKPTGNTTYEEIVCVGFQPELDRLEAVVHIKQPVGYGGDICTPGTPEYVRFFLSFDGGTTWQDQGLTSFIAHDIPDAAKHHIEYAVTLTITPRKRLCRHPNLVLARAILSWNIVPAAGDPDFRIHWGNRHDTTIQIAAARRPPLKQLLEEAQVKLPAEIEEILDPKQEIATVEPKPLTFLQLQALYKEQKVELHRFGFATALQLLENPQVLTAAALNKPVFSKELSIDVAAWLKLLGEPKGDTSYEQLDCVGLDPVRSELVATFRVKRGSGYSGGPCTPGSLEYITFWADFDDNGTFETCLGTAAVRVHDFGRMIPEGGLEYGVSLPVFLVPYQKLCTAGPRLVRIRALLSWHKPHPCASPARPPVWGNAVDTWIQIPPGAPPNAGEFPGYLYTVCEVNMCGINPSTGLTSLDQPFGGLLSVSGEIPAAPVVTTPGRFKYKVAYRSLDPTPSPTWTYLANDFWVWVTQGAGVGIPTTSLVLQQVDAGGWYTYLEYGTPVSGNWRRVTGPNRLLGYWYTARTQTARWEIRLEFLDTATSTSYLASPQVCPDGTRSTVTVYLDQSEPVPYLSPNIEVSADGNPPWNPAKECDTLVKGVVLRGTYSVSDEHFRTLNLYVEPSGAAHNTPVTPSSRSYGSPDWVPTGGETGTWTLNTANMDACGYVVRLDVWDRTILNCDADGWFNATSIGFCLKDK